MRIEVPDLEEELLVLVKHVVHIEVLDPLGVQVVVDDFRLADRFEG